MLAGSGDVGCWKSKNMRPEQRTCVCVKAADMLDNDWFAEDVSILAWNVVAQYVVQV